MGQDISVAFKKKDSKKAISLAVEGRAKYSPVNSAQGFVKSMDELSQKFNWDKEDEYSYSSRDFEESQEYGKDFEMSLPTQKCYLINSWGGLDKDSNFAIIRFDGVDPQEMAQYVSEIFEISAICGEHFFDCGKMKDFTTLSESFKENVLNRFL